MSIAAFAAGAAPAMAQKASEDAKTTSRLRPLTVTTRPVALAGVAPAIGREDGAGAPSPRGGCPATVSTYTDADFNGGTFVAQGGFAEQEVAAVSFVLAASAFPVKINMAEMIFATQNAAVPTTTQWSLLVWEGTPDTGTLQFEFSSDGKILPHIQMPAGTNGVNVQVMVDPSDPEQIILQDPGSRTFSIGYRIDVHNNQTANPCFTAPPQASNAFPTTDASGLSNSANNWLFGVNCGPFGCPANGGWRRFSGLSDLCRPTGDWVIRATWESVNCGEPVGACCLPTGCEIRSLTSCTNAGGTYRGDNITCGAADCPTPAQACCFPQTGGCLNLSPTDCTSIGGVPGGAGTTCQTFVCFPSGACCLTDGTCVGPVSPEDCEAQNGTFQGDGSDCSTVTCTIPTGSCCFSGGVCLNLTAADCTTAGGDFQGVGTSCGAPACPVPAGACCFSTGACLTLTQADCATGGGTYNGDGSLCGGSACGPACACDFNESGVLNSQDFFDFLSCFFSPGCTEADFNKDIQVNSQDFFDFLSCFFAPPAGC